MLYLLVRPGGETDAVQSANFSSFLTRTQNEIFFLAHRLILDIWYICHHCSKGFLLKMAE